jgi:iron complex transport system substrate-binding protein
MNRTLLRTIRTFSIALVLLSMVLPLIAAGAVESDVQSSSPGITDADYPQTFTDDMGSEVVLERKPESVLSLSLFSDEVLMELLPSESFSAVSTMAVNPIYSNVAEEAGKISPVIDFNVEQIIQLYPDLVIAANWSDAGKIDQLRQAGIVVYLIDTPFDIAGIKQAVTLLGDLTGSEKAAEALNAAIDQRLSSLQAKVRQIPDNEKKTALDYNSWGTANGADTTWNLVLSLAGIENAVAEMEVDDFGQVPLSKEVLLELNPDVLFLPSYIWGEEGASDAFYQQVLEDPALAGVAAIVENQVYIFPERLKNSYSQYLIDAAAAAAEMVYPDLFD